MRYYNPLYTRKWTKMFVPVSTFFTQLGEKNIHFYFLSRHSISRGLAYVIEKNNRIFLFFNVFILILLYMYPLMYQLEVRMT
jgi:hypothetical protein